MIHRSYRTEEAESPPSNFWISYGDLLAGLLLVFALLLVISLSHYAEFIRRKQQVLQAQEYKLTGFRRLEKRLIGDLQSVFKEEKVIIDPETGVMQIESGILFGEGESHLSEAGRLRLHKIFDAYIRVVLGDEFEDFVKQIEIEGHTNSHGGYLFNLELSQQRALAVMRELLDHAGEHKARLQEMVAASGRSYSHLVRNAAGQEDSVRSRRIEIRFRLGESEMLRDIYQTLVE